MPPFLPNQTDPLQAQQAQAYVAAYQQQMFAFYQTQPPVSDAPKKPKLIAQTPTGDQKKRRIRLKLKNAPKDL